MDASSAAHTRTEAVTDGDTATTDDVTSAVGSAATPARAPTAQTGWWTTLRGPGALTATAALAACGGDGSSGLADGTASLPAAFTRPPPDSAVPSRALGTTANADTAAPLAAAVSSTTPPLPTADELMDWAERTYAVYFPSHQPNLVSAPYVYRYYPETGNYVGLAGTSVYIFGPVAGVTVDPAFAGNTADFAARIYADRKPASDAEAARFLGQATLDISDSAIAAVRTQGFQAWLVQEMAKAPSTSNWDWMVAKGLDKDEAARNSGKGADPQIWQCLLSAPDGLRQRVTLALSEIFVVGFDGITGPWRQFKLAGWWDLLATHAFGNYRTLLEAISLNPAMGQYLSSAGNLKENPATGRLPDENYAREVMQLFSIGLYELNPDGTKKLDPSGNPIETYTQDTVTQLARVFTGWNRENDPFDAGPSVMRRNMVLTASQHSTLAVKFLGVTIPANTDGLTALRTTMDTLAAHPNVGPFIGRQLIQRLVTSNPSPSYVARVSAAWADNGAGVRGDLGHVVRVILTDVEARSDAAAAAPGYGKLREPMLRFIQWARTFKATSISTDWNVGDLSDPATRLGQSPLRSPSVFNYFRPGYVPAGTPIASAGLDAPEFQLANESSAAGYLNFMQSAIQSNRFDLKVDYSTEIALATDANLLIDRLQRLLCGGALQADTRSTIVGAVNSIAASTDTGKLNRVMAAVLLIMASTDYLVQK